MKKITVQITDEQEKFLKLFAANHYPGAKDNLATHHPIHIVQTKRIRHIPYSPDIADFYDHLPLVFTYNTDDYQLWFKNEEELVKQYYEDRGEDPPIPVKPFGEIQYTEVHDKDGNAVWICDYSDYFEVYGVEPVVFAWEEEDYEDVAFFFILEEARRYIKYQGHNLKEPRTYTYDAGYSNEGEYHHFWDLLFKLGEQLNAESKSENLATDAS
jgi:hypothetical protein